MNKWKCKVCGISISAKEYASLHSDAACHCCGSAVAVVYEQVDYKPVGFTGIITGDDGDYHSVGLRISDRIYLTIFKQRDTAESVIKNLRDLADKIEEETNEQSNVDWQIKTAEQIEKIENVNSAQYIYDAKEKVIEYFIYIDNGKAIAHSEVVLAILKFKPADVDTKGKTSCRTSGPVVTYNIVQGD